MTEKLQNMISFFNAHFEQCEKNEKLTKEDVETVRWMAMDLAKQAVKALKEMEETK